MNWHIVNSFVGLGMLGVAYFIGMEWWQGLIMVLIGAIWNLLGWLHGFTSAGN